MHHTPAQYAMWFASSAASVVILVAMIRRHLVPEYSLFFWYTVAHLVDSVVAFIANQISYAAYFYTYYGWEIIDAIFTLVVLQAVFVRVFDSYETLHGVGVRIFRWATTILLFICIITAIYAPGNQPLDHLIAALMVVERSIQLVQVGLLFCLLVGGRVLGLPWRHYIYGIIAGFGVYASLALVVSALWARFGMALNPYTKWMSALAYTLGTLTWAYYFVSPKAVAASAKPPSSAQLEEWNEALAGILRR